MKRVERVGPRGRSGGRDLRMEESDKEKRERCEEHI